MKSVVFGIGSVAAVFTVFTGAWVLYQTKDEYDRRMARLDQRLSSIEAISPDVEGSSVLRRIGSLEEQTSDLNSEFARLRADISQLNSITNGLGDQLAGRVADLEQAILSGGPAGLSQEVEARLAEIEADLASKAGTTVGGTGRERSFSSDYQTDQTTQSTANFAYTFENCNRDRNTVRCYWIIENTSSQRAELELHRSYSPQTLAYLPTGEALTPQSVQVGSRSTTGGEVARYFPSAIPARTTITWTGIDPEVEGFALIQLGLEDEDQIARVDFRNVAIN
ncbi:hypothetical protein [Marinicauda sp. Alg238-R41]|uniref:hypothetical protein n=1 Tax=Marinicauda sp. Alg238-R41 TaxID=2993447 RepID=UPI0022E925EF|nr:hypothetical protein [Marinicauda sp. Alg238-R41]